MLDGSGVLLAALDAQALFGGIPPPMGFLVQNNSLWVNDSGAAEAGGSSFLVPPNGGIFVTPPGYHPAGAVSVFGEKRGQAFAARAW